MSLSKLRAETAIAHAKLEKNLNLFEKVTDLKSYKSHLSDYHNWLKPVEASLKSMAVELPIQWEQRQRTPLLEKDLAHFAIEASAQNKKFKMQNPKNIHQCLGVLYTLEGSTLGGQFIYKHFSEKLNLNKDQGLAFYYGRGPMTGKLWKEFLQFLEQYMHDHPESTEEICHAARLTFEDVETALCIE